MMVHRGARSFEYKLVVVVRDDLNMSGGKLAVQVAHAAVTCAIDARSKKPKWFSGPSGSIPGGTSS